MPKDFEDPPKEPARKRAERKWRNYDLRKRVVAARQKPELVDTNNEPEIADTVTNDGRRDGSIRRFESKFKKDIRAMMEGHKQCVRTFYCASLQHQRRRLLLEKLRRLEAAQLEREISNVQQS
jgi:hypothetical protein